MKFKLGDKVVIDIPPNTGDPPRPKLYGIIVGVPPEGTLVLDNETDPDNQTYLEPFNHVNCECYIDSDISVWFEPDNERQYFVKMKNNQINMVFEQFLKPKIKKTLPKIDVASAAGGSKKDKKVIHGEGADRPAGKSYDIILDDDDEYYSEDGGDEDDNYQNPNTQHPNTQNPNTQQPSQDNSGSDENQSGGKKTRKKQLKKTQTKKTRQKRNIKRHKRKTRQKRNIKRHKRKTRQKRNIKRHKRKTKYNKNK